MLCDLGDIAINCEAYGAGRPIVILSGQPSDHRVMARFVEPLFASGTAGCASIRTCPARGAARARIVGRRPIRCSIRCWRH